MTRRHWPRLISCFLLSLFSFPSDSVHSFDVLPDTGQTKCYNNTGEIPCPAQGQTFYGQDGNYQGPQPAYQVSADGFVVTDLNTGLMWQRADDGLTRNWAAAGDYCDGLALGGYTDWRLPSRQEIVSIIDYGRNDPSINPVFSCQLTNYSTYWSGSTYAGSPTAYAWMIQFDVGFVSWGLKSVLIYTRCVRTGP